MASTYLMAQIDALSSHAVSGDVSWIVSGRRLGGIASVAVSEGPSDEASLDEVIGGVDDELERRSRFRSASARQGLRDCSVSFDLVSAGGEKESNAAYHMRANLRAQRLELLAKQRSQQKGKEDQILEESRRCCQALRGDRW